MKYHHQLLVFIGIKFCAMRAFSLQPTYHPRIRTAASIPGKQHQISSSIRTVLFRSGRYREVASTSMVFMSTKTTKTLSEGPHVSEMEVKKSRFLGYAKHAENWKEATAYIEEVKVLHPKARHWCYGFQCGVDPVSERCSDDGEPAGTAGLPILGERECNENENLEWTSC